MHSLDNPKYLARFDPSGAIRAIDGLAKQAEEAWRESQKIQLPTSYGRVHEIVMNGMGGSGLAGHIIEAAFRNRLKVPFFLIHGYDVPAHVQSHSLFILSSYSGNTEEVLKTRTDAERRGAKLLAIAAGGILGRAIREKRIPGYLFSGEANPGSQPRFGLGYSIFGLLGLLRAVGLLLLGQGEVTTAISALRASIKRYRISSSFKNNLAKQMAVRLRGHIPVFIGAEFLEDSARIMSNQLHETAKQFGFHFAIPELNHHLMEGLGNPRDFSKKLIAVFLNSSLYHAQIKQRFPVTKSVFHCHRIQTLTYRARGASPFAQIADTLAFGSYLTYYLSIMNRADPATTPWVDYFKEKLKK